MAENQSVPVRSATEKTELRRNTEMVNEDDLVEWLLMQRDEQSAVADTEMLKDNPDWGVINFATKQSGKFYEAAEEIRTLRQRRADLAEALSNRVIIEMKKTPK